LSEAVTRGVHILVRSEFIPYRSDPDSNSYFFAYHITIRNDGEEPVRLISRHWIIADASGNEQEVRGLGVVGKQPRLESGQSFDYTSACPLPTPVGSMRGAFQMSTDGGETFDASIAPFTLAVPGVLN
jgi:ApaG protein